MDGKPDPSRYNQPGAPELGKAAKIPEALPAEPVHDPGPVFQPTSTASAAPPAPRAAQPLPDEPVDEHQARINYLRSLRENRPKKSHKGRNIFLVLLLLLLVAGAGGYWWYTNRPALTKPVATKRQQPSKPSSSSSQATTSDGFTKQTKSYSATDFGLSLEYPADWTPAEQNGILTFTSPITTLTGGTGQTTQGRVILAVRPKDANPPELKQGNAVAVLPSEIIKYTNPTASQRGSTYVSFLQYASTTTKGGLDGVYVTGNAGFQYAQTVPASDITSVDPLIDVTFVSCSDDSCAPSAQTPLTISSKSWTGDLKSTIETMLASFTFE